MVWKTQDMWKAEETANFVGDEDSTRPVDICNTGDTGEGGRVNKGALLEIRSMEKPMCAE